MKTLRKLVINYLKEAAEWGGIALIALVVMGIVFTVMHLPGVAIAYFTGITDVEALKTAGTLSFLSIALIFLIIKGIAKIIKDYRRLKREDSKK